MKGTNEIVGLVIQKNEKKRLKELCLKYNVPILYEEVFDDKNDYFLWGFNQSGIGLVSTIVMQHTKNILHGLEEFETYLKKKVT